MAVPGNSEGLNPFDYYAEDHGKAIRTVAVLPSASRAYRNLGAIPTDSVVSSIVRTHNFFVSNLIKYFTALTNNQLINCENAGKLSKSLINSVPLTGLSRKDNSS